MSSRDKPAWRIAGREHLVTDADQLGQRNGFFQFARSQAVLVPVTASARGAQRQLCRLGHDGAVDAA